MSKPDTCPNCGAYDDLNTWRCPVCYIPLALGSVRELEESYTIQLTLGFWAKRYIDACELEWLGNNEFFNLLVDHERKRKSA